MKVIFCLPIKNEEDVLENNLIRLINYLNEQKFEFDWKVSGAINGSNDNSVSIIKKVKERFPDKIDFLVIDRPGKGGAIKHYWRQTEADVLSFMDADLAVSLSGIRQLIEPIVRGEQDMVIGSRFIANSCAERSWQRGFISTGYALFSRLILGHTKSDLQCGFKAISKKAFESIDKYLLNDYWFFDTELVVTAEMFNLRILEIAVNWKENREGTKKSDIKIFRDSLSFIWNILKFRFRLFRIKKDGNK